MKKFKENLSEALIYSKATLEKMEDNKLLELASKLLGDMGGDYPNSLNSNERKSLIDSILDKIKS